MHLSGRIKIGMAANGITSEAELARRVGCHRQTVHKWLEGESVTIDPKYLFKLADVLKCSARWLALREGGPQKFVQLDIDKTRLLDIYEELSQKSPKALDEWRRQGNGLLELTGAPSTGHPYKTEKSKQ